MPVSTASSDPQIIDGKYSLMRELGRGGSGTVYEAESLALGKRVALKLLHASVRDANARDSFLAEARTAAKVSHPNLVDVQDIGITPDGRPYVVMERLEGDTLAELLARQRPTPQLCCELLQQLLAGLAAIHRKGMIHGDLKPANVLVTYPVKDLPLLKILDFGSARPASSGEARRPHTNQPHTHESDVTWGTPMFMAPEQVQGEALDERVDVYAACALFYVLLTGAEPYNGKSARQVMQQVAAGEFTPVRQANPSAPSDLIEVIERGMKRKREERIGSVEELTELISSRLEARSLRPLNAGEKALAQVTAAAAPLPRRNDVSKLPESSVVRIDVSPRLITDSILVSPRLPKPPASPNLEAGRDFLPMHGDPSRDREVEQRTVPTKLPRRAAALIPALAAMLVGFSVGVVIAWAAGLI